MQLSAFPRRKRHDALALNKPASLSIDFTPSSSNIPNGHGEKPHTNSQQECREQRRCSQIPHVLVAEELHVHTLLVAETACNDRIGGSLHEFCW